MYFYTVGQKLGIDKLNYYASLMGFGEKIGIDLPGEQEGLLPSGDWKRKTINEQWYLEILLTCLLGRVFVSYSVTNT